MRERESESKFELYLFDQLIIVEHNLAASYESRKYMLFV